MEVLHVKKTLVLGKSHLNLILHQNNSNLNNAFHAVSGSNICIFSSKNTDFDAWMKPILEDSLNEADATDKANDVAAMLDACSTLIEDNKNNNISSRRKQLKLILLKLVVLSYITKKQQFNFFDLEHKAP